MAIPKEPSARQEDLIEYLINGNPNQVSRFVRQNDKVMSRFFKRYDPEFEVNDFIRVLNSGTPQGEKFCQSFIRNCMTDWAHKMPEKNLNLPSELRQEYRRIRKETRQAKKEAKRAKTWQEAKTEWNSLKRAGSNFRAASLAMKPVYAAQFIADGVAGGLSALNFSRPQRVLVQAIAYSAAATPVILQSAFGATMFAAVMGTTLDEANAGIPTNESVKNTQIISTEKTLKTRFGEQASPHILSYVAPPENGLGKTMDRITGKSDTSLSDPHAIYRPLLNLIEKGESTVGGYDAIYIPFANANKGTKFNLTGMSINDVRTLQKEMLAQGFDATPVGRYQVVTDTMDYLVKKMNLTGDEIFNADLQDRMAITLLKRRGVDAYLSGDMGENKFMWHLSREWASFPKDHTGVSYWKGTGNNKAHISPKDMLVGIRASGTMARISVPTTTLSINLPDLDKLPVPQSAPRGIKNG